METAIPDVVGFAAFSSHPKNAVLTRLFKEHYRHLCLFISARVRGSDESADLANQAFAEACKAFDSFRGESELRTWLYGIAMNLIRNHVLRSPNRRFQFVGEETLEDFEDTNEDLPRSLQSKQEMVLLQKHVDGLPAELRELLLMIVLDGLSYEEAAAKLSIPIGTVRSRVSRSRLLLRHGLAGDGVAVPQGNQ